MIAISDSPTRTTMKMLFPITLALAAIISFPVMAKACTNGFFLSPGKNFIGRNMDWPLPNGYVVINERGVPRFSFMVAPAEAAHWDTKYGYVAFELTQQVPGMGLVSGPVGGMNEKGLYAASLWGPGGKYDSPSSSDTRKAITIGEVVGFALAQYDTVKEAVDGIKSVQLRGFEGVSLHWFLADATGESAYVEFANGKTVAHMSPQPLVMANDSYTDERNYLKNYKGFGGKKAIPTKVDHAHINSLDRYLLLSKKIADMDTPKQPLTPDFVFAALDGVRHTPDKSLPKEAWESNTQWTEVYDYSTRTIYWKSAVTPGVKSLQLDKINFVNTGTKRLIPITQPGEGDMLGQFSLIY